VDHSFRPFFNFIKESIAKRNAEDSDIGKTFWKEATNSCYGKTAQGLRDKRTYNLQEKRSERTRRSVITNPFYAALKSEAEKNIDTLLFRRFLGNRSNSSMLRVNVGTTAGEPIRLA